MRIIVFLFLLCSPAYAAEWTTYSNPRFGANIDIPPGFVNDVPEPENGDGLVFHSADKQAELLVWGGNLTDGDFKLDSKSGSTGNWITTGRFSTGRIWQ